MRVINKVMNEEFIKRASYMSICSKEQIDRICSISSADDYLLKLRADTVLDHMRIFRVVRSHMFKAGDEWDFEKHFSDEPFKNYIVDLPDDDLTIAESLTAGLVFCDRPNGRIIKTEFGNVITVSESLRYFLYFMNLGFLDFDETEVPIEVKLAAIKIAVRTMLQSEALDFDIDPRGEVPRDVHELAMYHTDRQLEFICGHEYSHHLLGHLDDKKLIDGAFLSAIDSGVVTHKFFSYAQQEELDADLDALSRPVLTTSARTDLVNRALFFFVYLDVFNNAKEQIVPSVGVKEHPDPMDRFNNIHNYYKDKLELDEENLEVLLKTARAIKETMSEDIALHFESYEIYGSIYLAEWRGRVLVDRVDY